MKESASRMVEFRTQDDIETWLKDKPPEWAVVLAARAALRVLPTLAVFIQGSQIPSKIRDEIVLPTFRSAAFAWIGGHHRKFRHELVSSVFAGYLPTVADAAAAQATAAFMATYSRISLGNRDTGESFGYRVYAAASAAATTVISELNGSHANMQARNTMAFYGKSAISSLFSALRADAELLEWNSGLEFVGRRKLWSDKKPKAVIDSWVQLKACLLSENKERNNNENWQVWTDWYEARLHGRDPWPEEVEVACALIPDEIWKQGPAAANAEIKRIRDEWAQTQKAKKEPEREPAASNPDVEAPPLIPLPKPAALEPVLRAGKIALPKNPVASDLKGQSLAAALKALQKQIALVANEAALAAIQSPQIDKRHIEYLKKLSARVPPSRPRQEALFSFGHELQTLEHYQKIVGVEWPDFLAAQYLAMVRAYDRTLRQFPKWREFKNNATKGDIRTEDLADIRDIAQTISENLQSPHFEADFDEEIPVAVEALLNGLADQDVKPDQRWEMEEAKLELAADILESINNLYKICAELLIKSWNKTRPVLQELGRALREVGYAFLSAAKLGAKGTAKLFGYSFGSAAVSGSVLFVAGILEKTTGLPLLGHLVAKYPKYFSWAEFFLTLF